MTNRREVIQPEYRSRPECVEVISKKTIRKYMTDVVCKQLNTICANPIDVPDDAIERIETHFYPDDDNYSYHSFFQSEDDFIKICNIWSTVYISPLSMFASQNFYDDVYTQFDVERGLCSEYSLPLVIKHGSPFGITGGVIAFLDGNNRFRAIDRDQLLEHSRIIIEVDEDKENIFDFYPCHFF